MKLREINSLLDQCNEIATTTNAWGATTDDSEVGEMECSILREILMDWFLDRPVEAQFGVEGQAVEDGQLILGLRLGPVRGSVESGLLHEMGHLLEINDARILRWGWGFYYGPEQEIMGRTIAEPRTSQGVWRELKVIAYQKHLSDYYGMPLDLFRAVGALRFVPSWLWFKRDVLPQALKEEIDYDAGEEAAITAGVALVEAWSHLPMYSFDAMQVEWDRKMAAIAEME